MATLTNKALHRKATPAEALRTRATLGDGFIALRIQAFLEDDGTEQRMMLGALAYLIGLGAMTSARVPPRGQNREALAECMENIVRMARNGGIWEKEWAAQLSLAVEVSLEYFCDYRPLALTFKDSCHSLGKAIETGRLDDLVGALQKAGAI